MQTESHTPHKIDSVPHPSGSPRYTSLDLQVWLLRRGILYQSDGIKTGHIHLSCMDVSTLQDGSNE